MTASVRFAARCPRVRDRVNEGSERIHFSSAILPPYVRNSAAPERRGAICVRIVRNGPGIGFQGLGADGCGGIRPVMVRSIVRPPASPLDRNDIISLRCGRSRPDVFWRGRGGW
jgi:hypothetical protein